MGEVADMMIDGTLDSLTGEVIDGTAPGFPRTMHGGDNRCPVCGKSLKCQQGVYDHVRDKHAVEGTNP